MQKLAVNEVRNVAGGESSNVKKANHLYQWINRTAWDYDYNAGACYSDQLKSDKDGHDTFLCSILNYVDFDHSVVSDDNLTTCEDKCRQYFSQLPGFENITMHRS